MTNPRDDEHTSAYLWDPADTRVDPDVQALEQQLAPLRFDPATRPLELGRRALPVRRPVRRWLAFAAAASVVLAVLGWGFSQWRWSWPSGKPWAVSTRPSSVPAELAIGTPLSLASADSATVEVARIGTMRIDGGSRLALRSTQGSRHRLLMDMGRVSIRIWAPPGSLAIQTPAGDVIDLGCEFDLEVDASSSRVRVRTGWVQIDNGIDESLIPAGASSEMTKVRRPGVPVFDSADPRFRDAVRRYEVTQDAAVVDTIVATARAGDMLTLITLAARGAVGTDRILSRAAELWPLPDGVTVGGILRGDRAGLWRWRDTLPLPPVKGWLRNWRDALPGWLHTQGR